MKILNKKIDDNEKTFLIAEIGINHNGSMENALKMIDQAEQAGLTLLNFKPLCLNC